MIKLFKTKLKKNTVLNRIIEYVKQYRLQLLVLFMVIIANYFDVEIPFVFFLIGVVAPTVTTQSPTNVYATSCLGNGNITDIGGENATRRGFCYVLTNGVWSSGGNLAVARQNLAGCGTQTAGLSFGGNPYSPNDPDVTEEYNGTSWSSGGNLGTARRRLAGCGTQTAGLSFGGEVYPDPTVITEEYNGSSWSSGGNLATAREYLAGCGTQTAGLSFGGTTGSDSNITEEYNGTAWSSGGNLATARAYLAGCGTQTAGLSFGGNSPYITTEEYNGTAWSSGGDLATGRASLAGCGTQTAGLSFGGYYPNNHLSATEIYDGTAWSSGGNLSVTRSRLAGCGTQTAGLSFGGYYPNNYLSATEEYNIADPTTANNVAYDDGSFNTGAYTKTISSLSEKTGYKIRAYANNSVGTGYGATVQITTGETTTVSIQANANLKIINIISTFTGNASLKSIESITFLSDTNLKATDIIVTFTGDASLKSIESTTFTSNASLKSIESTTFTGDVSLKSIESTTFISDASLKSIESTTLTSNANLKGEVSASFTSDSNIAVAFVEFTGDSNLKSIISDTFTGNAAIITLHATTFTGDAIITPKDKTYSSNNEATLPTNDTNLEYLFTTTDYTSVSADDSEYAGQAVDGTDYSIFQFKEKKLSQDFFRAEWIGQSSLAPSVSEISLQVYNRISGLWETMDNDSTTAADVDLTLQGEQLTNLNNYYDVDNWLSFRVIQQNS